MNLQKNKNFNLDSEILTGLLGFGLIVLILYTIHDFLFSSDITVAYFDLLFVAYIATAYYLVRNYNLYEKLVFPLAVSILLSVCLFFFFQGGFKGTILFDFLILGFSYSIIFTDFRRIFLLVLHGCIFVGMLIVQLEYPHLIQNSFSNSTEINTILGFLLAMAFITYGAVTFRRHYDKANSLIQKQNEEAGFKNREIKKKNKELRKKALQIELINQRLNTMVKDKTDRLERQNNQLIEYAFFNSHKVRGPLARIMGLVELIKSTRNSEEKNLYLAKLEESANELDQVVSEINKILVEA